MSNFNYCPIVWISLARNRSTELRIYKNAPCVLCWMITGYHDLLIQSEVPGIKIMTLCLLAIEVFKCVNKLNPEYLYEMFTIKKCPYDFRDTSILERSKSNTTRFGLKSFRNYGAKYGICYQTTVNQLYHWLTLRIWSNHGMARVVSAQFVVCF